MNRGHRKDTKVATPKQMKDLMPKSIAKVKGGQDFHFIKRTD